MTFIVTNAAFKATLNERRSARRFNAYNKNEKYFGMHIALRCKKYQVSVKIKFFFQTPFFIDYKSSFATCVPCSVLSHLRIQCSFTNYFKTFWNFACLLTKQVTSFMKMHRPENNEVKWRFLYARRPRNFSHYLEHIKAREMQKVTFLLMTIGLLFYYPDYHQNPWSFLRLLLSIKKP